MITDWVWRVISSTPDSDLRYVLALKSSVEGGGWRCFDHRDREPVLSIRLSCQFCRWFAWMQWSCGVLRVVVLHDDVLLLLSSRVRTQGCFKSLPSKLYILYIMKRLEFHRNSAREGRQLCPETWGHGWHVQYLTTRLNLRSIRASISHVYKSVNKTKFQRIAEEEARKNAGY